MSAVRVSVLGCFRLGYGKVRFLGKGTYLRGFFFGIYRVFIVFHLFFIVFYRFLSFFFIVFFLSFLVNLSAFGGGFSFNSGGTANQTPRRATFNGENMREEETELVKNFFLWLALLFFIWFVVAE